MLNFLDARSQILAEGKVLGAESIPLSRAHGRVLAEQLSASEPLPPFDYSAMDGYAVRAQDVNERSREGLPLAGESRAGDTVGELEAGTARRIFTGAALPHGADAVVIQENAEQRDGRVFFSGSGVRPFDNVRRAGEDIAQGAVALEVGTRLGPFQLGLAAALDRAQLRVARRPKLRLFATGSELRAPGSPRIAGRIPESNSVALAALATLAGAEVAIDDAVADDLDATTRRFQESFGSCDVLVTVGGVSVGDHDLVRPALQAAGATLNFWKVALKPGKPLTFGRAGQTLILGLPGNPVSAQITFALFGVPLLRTLQGDAAPLPQTTRVVLADPLSQKAGRLGLYRARLDGNRAHVADNQASGSTLSLAHADAIVMMPAELTRCEADEELDAIRLREL
ncbi:MAG: molybdopterin molybdotransferase MoeA [Polyangiaceae bacterium]